MGYSPYEGLGAPISVQAWGYQLKVDNASDKRFDEFVQATRIVPAPEPGATCSSGITTTAGATPQDTTGQGIAQKG